LAGRSEWNGFGVTDAIVVLVLAFGFGLILYALRGSR
jgi:hypothetical protein